MEITAKKKCDDYSIDGSWLDTVSLGEYVVMEPYHSFDHPNASEIMLSTQTVEQYSNTIGMDLALVKQPLKHIHDIEDQTVQKARKLADEAHTL